MQRCRGCGAYGGGYGGLFGGRCIYGCEVFRAIKEHDGGIDGFLNCLRILRRNRNKYMVTARDMVHRTPLHFASIYGHVDICELLLLHGANLDAVDITGVTPLMASACPHSDVRDFLQRGSLTTIIACKHVRDVPGAYMQDRIVAMMVVLGDKVPFDLLELVVFEIHRLLHVCE